MYFSIKKEEQKELDEILAKRSKKGKKVDEKPMEEKSIMHCKYFVVDIISAVPEMYLDHKFSKEIVQDVFQNDFDKMANNFSIYIIPVKEPLDYQGRTFMHVPQDVGVNLKSEFPPEKCFLPKKHIHTWTGHTKGR